MPIGKVEVLQNWLKKICLSFSGMREKVEKFEMISFPENPGLVGNSLRKKKIFKGQRKFSHKLHSSPTDHPYNTSAKGLGGWGQKMATFADVQYCIFDETMGGSGKV